MSNIRLHNNTYRRWYTGYIRVHWLTYQYIRATFDGRRIINMKLNEMIPPPPVTARHTHSPKLLLCSHFEENNSMRHFRTQNLVCNHRNLRLFDAQRRIISHQCSGLLCVCGARMERVRRTHVCGTGTCVWYARVRGTCALACACKTWPALM